MVQLPTPKVSVPETRMFHKTPLITPKESLTGKGILDNPLGCSTIKDSPDGVHIAQGACEQPVPD